MKKCIFFSIICFSLFMASCNSYSVDLSDDLNVGKIRYEASITDTVNYRIIVTYMEQGKSNSKTVVVNNHFAYELKAEQGKLLWLSASASPRYQNLNPTIVTAKMYIDDELYKTSSDSVYSLIQTVYGYQNIQIK